MLPAFRFVACLMLGSCVLTPHDLITTKITWSREISRIFVQRCVVCHRGGGAAPFPFETYEQARPWAKAIKEEVLQRRMPPWGAVKGFGDLHPDASLTQEEVNRIAEWVEGGAPQGDPSLLPLMRPPLSKDRHARPTRIAAQNGFVSSKPVVLIGIEPAGSVNSAKIIAAMPNGQLIPLLWLRHYKGEWKRQFWLRTPLTLPPGAAIRMQGQAAIVLLTATPKRPR